MKKYLILADASSPHTLKWVIELKKYFDVYVISFNACSASLLKKIEEGYFFDLSGDISVKGSNFNVLKKIPKVVKIINRINPHFINAHYITSYGTVAVLSNMLADKQGKLILSAWGTDILVTPKKTWHITI